MRRALIASLFVFAFGAPAAAAVFDTRTATLSNGMTVALVPKPGAPASTHMLWYRVGAADERPGESGIAHLLEHMMFKGTETMAPGAFSDLIARLGGQENAFTSWDYTAYFQTVAKENLGEMMRLEADRLANIVLTDEEVGPEIGVVMEERRSRIENDPGGLLGEMMNATLYMNHPYGRPIIGWGHEIEALDAAALRRFHQDFYHAGNAVLVVAGDWRMEELLPLAETHYGGLPAPETPRRVRPREPVAHAAREVRLVDARVRQPAWRREYIAPSYATAADDEPYAIEVLSQILGGGATSRLYRALVVEQGIAASAGAWYSPDMLDQTGFTLYASPAPGEGADAEAQLAALEAAVEAEIAAIIENGVSEEEVARAQRRLTAAAVFARDSLAFGARVVGVALTTGQSVEDVEAWPARIEAVTAEAVQAAARALFDEKRSVDGLLLPEPQS